MNAADERVNELVDVMTTTIDLAASPAFQPEQPSASFIAPSNPTPPAPGLTILEIQREIESLHTRARDLAGRAVSIRSTYYASILERNRKLERLLTWAMENTDAGHKQPGQFCVRWVDDRFNTQITCGSSYEEAIDTAMALDAQEAKPC